MKIKYINEANLKNKKVLLRADLNLPLNKETGEITDDTRLTAIIPTLEYIISQGASVMILSHLGRPKTGSDKVFYSLEKVVPKLKEKLPSASQIFFVKDILKPPELKEGSIALGENVRFFSEESNKDQKTREEFAKRLSSHFDLYVNEAFSASHRDHASVTGIPKFLSGYAGFLLKKEITNLALLEKNIQRPYVAIVGGAKISTKITVLKKLIKKIDHLLIGGAMTYTFLKSRAIEIGNSMFEKDFLPEAFQIIDTAGLEKKKLLLPIDHIVSQEISNKTSAKVVKQNIPDGFIGVDIGPKTLKEYIGVIQSAKTIFWNGPMGVFEIPKFRKGTVKLAKTIAKSKAISIIGGGDSINAVKMAGVQDKITHISTGGGASLKFIEGSPLPGISALEIEK